MFTDIEVSHRINLCNATQGFAECLNGRCYKVFQKCDGKLDCEDGTDESNCKLKLEFCNGNGQGWKCSEGGMTDLFSFYLMLALWYPVIEWGGLHALKLGSAGIVISVTSAMQCLLCYSIVTIFYPTNNLFQHNVITNKLDSIYIFLLTADIKNII